MKVTYSWLKDFVNITLPPEKLADKLTMAGLEVTSLSKFGDDHVFEIEVTPNRSDCLSVLGIAREIAAITGRKMRPAAVKKAASPRKARSFPVKVESGKDCPVYTAKIIRGVNVGPSPKWLAERVSAVGLRPVNNIVDITNYVLYETGQPLHAFDLDKIKGGITVRRAKQGEEITAIDGKKCLLNKDVLVIADNAGPVAIAGVMGGIDTEINADTKNILIETALFDPIVVRRGRSIAGASTDSSYRFERGVDRSGLLGASERAAGLVISIASGQDEGMIVSGGLSARPRSIILKERSVLNLLGIDISTARTKAILAALGFGVKKHTKEKLSVSIPSFRQDVSIEADLIEEIARIYGYDNIPSCLPAFRPRIDEETLREIKLKKGLRDALISQGLDEAISVSLLNYKLLEELEYPADELRPIVNPLNSQQCVLRPTLLCGLLDAVRTNLNQRQDRVAVYEWGRRFFKDTEEDTLAFALSGENIKCLAQGISREGYSLFHAKGVIEGIFRGLGINDYGIEEGCCVFFAEGRSFSLAAQGDKLGVFGEIEAGILDTFGIKNAKVFAAEIQIEKVFRIADLSRRYSPLPSFPSIRRDISLTLKKDITAQEVKKVIVSNAAGTLKDVSVVDCYYGKQIPGGYKGLMLACLYRSDDHTLTDEEANSMHDKVLKALVKELKAEIR